LLAGRVALVAAQPVLAGLVQAGQLDRRIGAGEQHPVLAGDGTDPLEQVFALGGTRHREQAVAGLVERLGVDPLPGETEDLLAFDAGALADEARGLGTDAGYTVV